VSCLHGYTSADNYRAIAGGCLLLKLIDTIILLLEGEKFGCDVLQFGYQAKSSTTMCTWTVTAVVDHFCKGGAPVYGAAMDMSKAFDLVEWIELFLTLVDRQVEPIFLKVILFIYKNQKCDVKWCEAYSQRFSVCNGVRQGAVSSAILFAVYIDKLLIILRSSGFGCHIHGVFLGALIFADDIMLLSASCSGLQTMVDICQEFLASKNLKFGTNPDPDKSKTKCIVFSKKKRDWQNLLPVKLNGDPLPWVNQVKHLGNTLQNDNSMSKDVLQKRGKCIGKINSLMQEFHFTDPAILTKLVNIYATSFYGSGAWNIYSAECEKLYSSWNVAIRMIFNLDRCTHRYLIEPLSQCLHPKVMIASRYVTFYQSLVNCNKFGVRFLARLNESDHRTVLGSTLRQMRDDCSLTGLGLGQLTAQLVKKKLLYFKVPDGEQWRIPLLQELLKLRQGHLKIDNLNSMEISNIIDHLCTT
jgi:hypothetical protein